MGIIFGGQYLRKSAGESTGVLTVIFVSYAAYLLKLKSIFLLHIRIFFMIDFFQKHVQRSNPEPAVFV